MTKENSVSKSLDEKQKPLKLQKSNSKSQNEAKKPSASDGKTKIIEKKSTNLHSKTNGKMVNVQDSNQKTKIKLEKKPTKTVANARTKPPEPRKNNVPDVKIISQSRKTLPLKASHSIGAKSSTKNVMNQIHNVTVSSPPPVRREIIQVEEIEPQQSKQKVQIDQKESRERTRTRTLDESEIVLLKPKQNNTNEENARSIEAISNLIDVKPPVSFEVPLNDNNDKKLDQLNDSNAKTDTADVDENEYEDDFESYESDFETDITSENDTVSNETTISSNESEEDDNVISTASKHPFDTGQSIDNNEYDSGSFELKVLSGRSQRSNFTESKSLAQKEQQLEMQNDSGVENNAHSFGSQSAQTNSLTELGNEKLQNISDDNNSKMKESNYLDATNSDNSTNFNSNDKMQEKLKQTKSQMAKRGEEILRKITLDVMNYVLFDFKPIPYELFMKIYGKSDTAQIAIQTHNNRIDQESQCDSITKQTIWTQYPITFYTQHMNQIDYANYKNGCGILDDDSIISNYRKNEKLAKTFENNLHLIQNMSLPAAKFVDEQSNNVNANITTLNINYENLNRFLLESELTLSRIIYKTQNATNIHIHQLKEPIIPISNGYFTINISSYSVFNGQKLKRIFTHASLPSFLFALYDDTATELNVIAIWNLALLAAPICLLSVWSRIECIEIHPKIRDVIIAGLNDG